MIVRLMGEGQYRGDDELEAKLNELDARALAALERNDESELDRCLDEMWSLVRAEGTPLAHEVIAISDVIIPPSDLTLEETRQLMSADGFIPDLPAE